MIGETVANYEVTALLGEGGMGQVFRATDTKLKRDVALKVLPKSVTQDPGRLARFQREAEVIASLNHSNIGAIYGLEESDSSQVLVLELVEGEDLSEYIARGPLPHDAALNFARQIAEALEAAHEQGIIHRDLKPANIKITPEGQVKVLDFGLAKVMSSGPETALASSTSRTLTRHTREGTILGTAAYMSPEQAAGRVVDQRSDIWAFGCVLFECLTGEQPFRGGTVVAVLSRVLEQEPDWSMLSDQTPQWVRQLLLRCLEKEPRTRLRDIGEARIAIENSGGSQVPAPPAPGVKKRLPWGWVAALVLSWGLVLVLALTEFGAPTGSAPTGETMHFVVESPREDVVSGLAMGELVVPAMAPDGQTLAYTAFDLASTDRLLWLRPLASPRPRALPGTKWAEQPFWAPDSSAIAFVAGDALLKWTLASGTVRAICTLPGPASGVGIEPAIYGGTWGVDGTIVFSWGGALYTVPASGGEAILLLAPDQLGGERALSWPQFLPDGRHLLFVSDSSQEATRGAFVAPLNEPTKRSRVVPHSGRVAFASDHLLFVRDGTLFAQPFDVSALKVISSPTPLIDGVAAATVGRNLGLFGLSSHDSLAYLSPANDDVQLIWVDRDGKRVEEVGPPGAYSQIVLSPDGLRIAASVQTASGSDLQLIDIARGIARPLTTHPGIKSDPVWSPDGSEVAFSAFREDLGVWGIYRQNLDKEEAPTPLLELEEDVLPESWSADGQTLLFVRNSDVWQLPVSPPGPAEPAMTGRFPLSEPRLSQDRRWVAFIASESGVSGIRGKWEVYLAPFGREGRRVRVSTAGGYQPKWRRDGKEIFFLAPEGNLMAASVTERNGELTIGTATELFGRELIRPSMEGWQVSADGQRFLVKTRAKGASRETMRVVLNWPSLLR